MKWDTFLKVIKFHKDNFGLSVRLQSTNKANPPQSHEFKLSKPRLPTYIKDIQVKENRNSKSKITPGSILLLSVPLATFGLGTWQVQRRKWKLGLIEELEKRANEPVIDLPENLDDLSSMEYKKVQVRGKFDHSNECFIGPRKLNNKNNLQDTSGIFSESNSKKFGHCVVTPFILSDSGKRILVNRGWVPTNRIKAEKRLQGQIEDEVELTGVVRLNEKRGTFMPTNRPHLNIYHYRDLKTMSIKYNTLPVYIEATEDSTVEGGPIGGQTNVSLRNDHTSYIITWYSLSALTLFAWCKKFIF